MNLPEEKYMDLKIFKLIEDSKEGEIEGKVFVVNE
jgi:hypothetical protein